GVLHGWHNRRSNREGEDDRSVGAMAEKIQLDVVTPERRVLAEPVDMVTVPGLGGEMGILPGHTPLISQLQTGVLTYVQEGKSYPLHVSGGFVEVRDDHVSVLADVAELPDEIDGARAKLSRDKLEKQLNAWTGSEEELETAKVELDRSLVRLQLASSR
ncbi:MAG TPA: F0F1 ATP synthase subunit epsilon, partial [Pyrinomonadaceae bacterium]|nr:F0F1 ATP synthase subunit epsilon [Pyrinomonadaceae bacterium]